jgi:uncharacterized protein YukE
MRFQSKMPARLQVRILAHPQACASNASDLNQVLRQMAQALRTAAENYQSAERTNTSVWS